MQKIVDKTVEYIPSVERPTFQPSFTLRLKWTLAALLIYFVLAFIPVYGIEPKSYSQYRFFEIVLGAKFGSIMTLGTGPIVTSGIILQLLVGSKILNWNLSDPEDRKKFQSWSKFLAFLFAFVEAAAFVLGGALPVRASYLIPFVILQIAFGGILVILIDDLVSKWGFGSGVSLIIAAGVANSLIISLFSPFALYEVITPTGTELKVGLPSLENPPVGLVWRTIVSLITSNYELFILSFLPIIATLIVFLIITYVQDISVDIPLTFTALRGFGRTWGLKLLYTSVIPIILTSALVANLNLIAQMTQNELISSTIYFLTSPTNFLENLFLGKLNSLEIVRAITYTLLLCLLAAMFSYFWMNTSGMDPKSVAEQIAGIRMQIPGFRSNVRVIESVLNKYIPTLAILGGLLMGLLAALADLTGAVGSGTGILLLVMIIYNYYEILSRERLEEAPSFIRKFLGE
jgi:preprotein translocase subunit SecY